MFSLPAVSDFRAVLERLWRPGVLPERPRQARPPSLVIRRTAVRRPFCPGLYTRSRHRIDVEVGPGMGLADVVGTLLHEATHAAGPMGHDRTFRFLFREVARAAAGIWLPDVDVPQPAFDDSVVERLEGLGDTPALLYGPDGMRLA
jgi:hypothetical protein